MLTNRKHRSVWKLVQVCAKILCHIEEDRIKDFMWHRRRCDCAYAKIPRHVAVKFSTRT